MRARARTHRLPLITFGMLAADPVRVPLYVAAESGGDFTVDIRRPPAAPTTRCPTSRPADHHPEGGRTMTRLSRSGLRELLVRSPGL